MKKYFLLAIIFNALLITSCFSQSSQIMSLNKGIYLVVGSFQNKSNALNFRNKLEKSGRDASISFSDQTLFYYVHIKTFDTVDEAILTVKPTREKTPFKDAWALVYSIDAGMTAISSIPIKNEQSTDSIAPNSIIETNIVSPAILSSDIIDQSLQLEKVELEKYNIERVKNEKDQYLFYFNTFNFVTNAKVNGKINLIDPVRLKLIRQVNAHKAELVNNPHNQDNKVQFIAEIFGYKKAQHDVNLVSELSEEEKKYITISGDTVLMDFPLKRHDKGDVIVMYNVFFYKDAAIMKSESKFELNSLLEMLKELPDYKIQISGHTNGNASGKIIEIDNEIPEYFSLSQATKEKNGSAKKLSLKRAEIIQKYLLNNGIDPNRMEVKGWGGKKPLYDKFDRLASKNVRVEIEISLH